MVGLSASRSLAEKLCGQSWEIEGRTVALSELTASLSSGLTLLEPLQKREVKFRLSGRVGKRENSRLLLLAGAWGCS